MKTLCLHLVNACYTLSAYCGRPFTQGHSKGFGNTTVPLPSALHCHISSLPLVLHCLKFMCPHTNNRQFIFLGCTKLENRSLQLKKKSSYLGVAEHKTGGWRLRSQPDLHTETISEKGKRREISYSSRNQHSTNTFVLLHDK